MAGFKCAFLQQERCFQGWGVADISRDGRNHVVPESDRAELHKGDLDK